MAKSFMDVLRDSNLKMDEQNIYDVSYGVEYFERHEESTFKNPQTIFADTRLKAIFDIIMREGIDIKSTDIQIMPQEKNGIVRYRIGRKMVPYRALHKGAVESLATYTRMLAETNPEKIKNPESSSLRFEYSNIDSSGNRTVDVYDTRFEFYPSQHGTVVSIRIFYPDNLDKKIDDLGLSDLITMKYKQALNLREGLIILSGPTGSGKALSVKTPIPLAKGQFKELRDIQVGDMILDESGQPTKVLATYDHTGNKCYKIMFNDGLSIVADEDHNWSVYTKTGLHKVKTTKQLLKTYKNYRFKNTNGIHYPKQNIRKQAITKGRRLGKFKKRKDGSFKTKRITPNYMYGDIMDRFFMLNGLRESCGKTLPDNKVELKIENWGLLAQIKQLINSFGYNIIQTSTKDKTLIYQIKGSETKGEKPLPDGNLFRRISYIQEVESEPTKCLTVDSPNNLFLCTTNYLVTHNTTTEYVGILQILEDSEYSSNVLTIENPIEYKIPGIIQSEVNDAHNFGFADAIRSFLRMNPDVLLIGEVRDEETAKSVTRAATSGHLALTTIHANSSLEVLDVLKQYGVHPSEINQAVKLIIFQVLEDKLCPHCRTERILTPMQKKWLDNKMLGKEQLSTVFEKNPQGCQHCDYKGIKDRIMLNEMLSSSFEFRVLKDEYGANVDKLKSELIKSEDGVYYPIEWDVHRRIKEGDIDFETATRLIH